MDTLVNKVANSGLITINLEHYYPEQDMITFDLKDYLFMEMILKEKDFRKALKEHDWAQYENKVLLVTCSADAIIPLWAYLLITSYAQPYAYDIYKGDEEAYLSHYYHKLISAMDMSPYAGQRIVIKGCSKKDVPEQAYIALARALRPEAQSIMFGEPCSTVPIYKRPRQSR